jgi:hypothetical protein
MHYDDIFSYSPENLNVILDCFPLLDIDEESIFFSFFVMEDGKWMVG